MSHPNFLQATTRPDLLEVLGPIALPTALGFVAVYLLLPRPNPYPRLWGAAVGGLALLLAGWFSVRGGVITTEAILFYAFALIAVVSGAVMITQRNPARAALSFALVVLSTCGLFLLQAAPFLMAATIIIYAGAIVVTFLFVIMLAQQAGRSDADDRSREPFMGTLCGFVLLGALLYVLHWTYYTRDDKVDDLVRRAQAAANQPTPDEMVATLKPEAYFSEWDQVHLGPDLEREKRIQEIQVRWTRAQVQKDHAAMRAALLELPAIAGELREKHGQLHPNDDLTLSPGSGPPANEAVPRDSRGRATLPADNTAYLGRSLFSDYLLAVELGGTLLLVATIGAIVIAARRAERAL